MIYDPRHVADAALGEAIVGADQPLGGPEGHLRVVGDRAAPAICPGVLPNPSLSPMRGAVMILVSSARVGTAAMYGHNLAFLCDLAVQWQREDLDDCG